MKYNIILSDNPWSYSDRAAAGNRGADFKYKTMSMEDLRGLRIGDLAAEDCAHFMWVTGPFMHEGLHLMKQYGFEQKNVAFTWIKMTKGGVPATNMGHYTRGNAEFVLLGVKGRMTDKRVSRGVNSVIITESLEHSRKPPELRDRIVKLFGDIPRVELFARKPDIDPGWTQTGLEFDGRLVQDFIREQTGTPKNGLEALIKRTQVRGEDVK